MDETATRRKKIDPKLYEVGWEQVPESEILTEQRAYQISPGQVSAIPQNRHPKKADYLLAYRKQPSPCEQTELVIGSEQYQLLTQAFYL